MGAATLVGNGAAYLLSMVAARVLTPEEFGAMGALLGILVIISTVGIATVAAAQMPGQRPVGGGYAFQPRLADAMHFQAPIGQTPLGLSAGPQAAYDAPEARAEPSDVASAAYPLGAARYDWQAARQPCERSPLTRVQFRFDT